MSEWEGIKALIYSNTDWAKKLKTSSWKSFNRSHGAEFPNLMGLIDLLLTIPASTPDCERGFSAMKRIKTDWRASPDTSTLSDLMCGLLESCDIDSYDPDTACSVWAEDMHRKPSYKRVKRVTRKKKVPIVRDEESNKEETVIIDEDVDDNEESAPSDSSSESEATDSEVTDSEVTYSDSEKVYFL